MTRVQKLLAIALGVSTFVACGPDNGLSGSLSQVFPLDISGATVARNNEALQVTYYLNRGVFLDVVVRVSAYIGDVDVKPGAKVTLGGQTDGGVERCVVAHAPGGEPVRLMPPVKRGDLVITGGGEPGEVTRGNFSMLFEEEGGDIGFGRTLVGSFAANTTDAGFGDLP